jgi:hypothetical protein
VTVKDVRGSEAGDPCSPCDGRVQVCESMDSCCTSVQDNDIAVGTSELLQRVNNASR